MPGRTTPATNQVDVTNLAMMVGEMRGQMREVVHTMNNISTKIDAVGREVVAMGPMGQMVAELKAEIAATKAEVALLKQDKAERTGASNLVNWVFRNWPGVVGFVLLIGILLRAEGKL